MGENVEKGEVRQLIVEGGWWKASELPEEDLEGDDKERIGCLISEVVVRTSRVYSFCEVIESLRVSAIQLGSIGMITHSWIIKD